MLRSFSVLEYVLKLRCVVYASNSPIIVDGGKGWNQDVDAASEKSWFKTFSSSVRSDIRTHILGGLTNTNRRWAIFFRVPLRSLGARGVS